MLIRAALTIRVHVACQIWLTAYGLCMFPIRAMALLIVCTATSFGGIHHTNHTGLLYYKGKRIHSEVHKFLIYTKKAQKLDCHSVCFI